MKHPLWTYYVRGAVYTLGSILAGTRDMRADAGYGYSTRAAKAARALLPYALNPLRDDNDPKLIWLNRDYKPLGVLPYGDFVNYWDFPHLHVSRSDPLIQPLLRVCKDHGGQFYLFDDRTSPDGSKAAAKRLLGLLQLVDLPKEGL